MIDLMLDIVYFSILQALSIKSWNKGNHGVDIKSIANQML